MTYLPGSGVAALMAATVFWSLTAVFVKHFAALGIDGDTQNLFRYAAAAAGLWLWTPFLYGRELARAMAQWRLFWPPVALNCVFQVIMVSSLYHVAIYPGFMSLLGQSAVIFTTVLAFLLFREERPTILSRRYLTGCALAVLGVAGVVLFREGARLDFNEGVALVLLSSLLWAGYTVSMKPVVRQVNPIVAFTVVATYTAAFFLLLALVRSEPARFFQVGLRGQCLVVLSGVLCISAAHSIYFIAVRKLGVAICASFLLVQPLLTGLLSAVVLQERLTAAQMAAGVLLLLGAFLIVRTRAAGAEAHAEPTETPEG
jgi:drug/metabolite transporter (DMT)-like permease